MKVSILDDYFDTLRTLDCYRKLAGHDVHALKGVSLDIKQGERVFLCGASGSGKTTLLYILGGMEKPTSGRVDIMGADLYDTAKFLPPDKQTKIMKQPNRLKRRRRRRQPRVVLHLHPHRYRVMKRK